MTKQTSSKQPEFQSAQLSDLYFDPRNPRFGGEGADLSQAKIQQLLFDPPHSASLLVDSFVENGFISYEPLVVRREKNKFIVIEGNRRLAAVKHIVQNPEKYPESIVQKLQNIPVLIFHEAADASHLADIRTYLGVRHLVGYREWPAESKAVFLDANIKGKNDLKHVMKEFNIRKQDIYRYLVPYRVKKATEELLNEYQIIEDQSFWMLGEALSRAGIKEYIELEVDPDSLKIKSFNKSKFQHLLEYLYGTSKEGRPGSYRAIGTRRVTETRQLTRLSNVLASKKASQKLEQGATLEEAELYVQTPEETIQSLIEDVKLTLQKVIALKPSEAQISDIAELFKTFQRAVTSFTNAKSKV